jgi:hypothetical protein
MRTREEILAYNRAYNKKHRKRLSILNKIRYKHICKKCGIFFRSANVIQDCCSLSCAAKDNRNKNWKGGISPLRQRLSASKEWIALKNLIYKKFNNICQCCGKKIPKTPRKKHMHHKNGFKNKKEFFDVNKLTLWCRKCHLSYHNKKNANINRLKRKKTT